MAVRLPISEGAPIPGPETLPSAEPEDEGRLLRVGDLAQRTGKSVRALHLYEELSLLHPRSRSDGGYRLYGVDAVVRVRWISKLQEMGFSLPDIRELLHQWEQSGSASGAMTKIRALYAQKLAETKAQITRLQKLEKELEGSIDYLDTCERCDPARLVAACPHCDLHGCGAPELVAGLHSQRA